MALRMGGRKGREESRRGDRQEREGKQEVIMREGAEVKQSGDEE